MRRPVFGDIFIIRIIVYVEWGFTEQRINNIVEGSKIA